MPLTQQDKEIMREVVEDVRRHVAAARLNRRHKLPAGECKYCDGEKGTFHPSHDASDKCESGKRAHCSCDTCF